MRPRENRRMPRTTRNFLHAALDWCAYVAFFKKAARGSFWHSLAIQVTQD
jgi:hypothetical protein